MCSDNYSARIIIELDLSDATKQFICEMLGKDGEKYVAGAEERIKNLQKGLNELVNGAIKATNFTIPETPDPAEATQECKEPEAPSIDVTSLKTLASQKAKNNREAIKAKLAQLGTNKIGELDKAKYEEFYEFLNNLKE